MSKKWINSGITIFKTTELHDKSIYCLVLAGFLPIKMGVHFLWIFALLCIYHVYSNKQKQPINRNQTLLFGSLILFSLINIGGYFINTDNYNLKILEQQIPFLLLPLLFLASRVRIRNENRLFTFSILVSTFLALSCFAIAIYYSLVNKGFQNWPFKYYNFTFWINYHPGYLSLVLIITTILNVELIKRNKKLKIKNTLFTITLLFQVFTIFFIGSRYGIIVLCLLLIVYLMKFGSRGLRLLIFVIIPLVVTLAFFGSLNTKSRMLSTSQAISSRIDLFNANFMFFLENPITGHGINFNESKRDHYYEINDLVIPLEKGYNSHNQYLNILINNGIVGFLVFSVIILSYFRITGFSTYKSFLAYNMLVFFLVEVLLSRYTGSLIFLMIILIYGIGLGYDKKDKK